MQEAIQLRADYVRKLRMDLVGPGSETRTALNLQVQASSEHVIKDVFDETDVNPFVNELITECAEQRYSVGILYPQETQVAVAQLSDESEDDPAGDDQVDNGVTNAARANVSNTRSFESSDSTEDDECDLDAEAELANSFRPSSLGLTFFAKNSVARVAVKAFCATYRRSNENESRSFVGTDENVTSVLLREFHLDTVIAVSAYESRTVLTLRQAFVMPRPAAAEELISSNRFSKEHVWEVYAALKELSRQLRNGFVRIPHAILLTVDLDENGHGHASVEGHDPICASVSVNRRCVDGRYFGYTVMFVNDSEAGNDNATALLQARVQVDQASNPDFEFVSYAGTENFESLDAEEQSLALQYRDKKVYATGLGSSADWGKDATGNFIIRTECMPAHEIPKMSFDPPGMTETARAALSMKGLSDLSELTKDQVLMALKEFRDSYARWIRNVDNECKSLDDRYERIASRHVERCRECLNRISGGIDMLSNDENAFDAFRWANRAMFMQQIRRMVQAKLSDGITPQDEALTAQNRQLSSLDAYRAIGTEQELEFVRQARTRMPAWRPFQLAFLLMSMPSANDDSPDRSLVDLIWFPTGGGKTEAYLGLTAFTIFYRRLRHANESDGTAVIMRYTLRLLAAQQFERASALICACEVIRRMYPARLGQSEISIGLWIGGTQTPNTFTKACEVLNEMRRDPAKNEFQVLRCPWCGAPLAYGNRSVDWGYIATPRNFVLRCPNRDCDFGRNRQKLPLQVVDEGLYTTPPTLLFGTVDKFAQMAWRPEVVRFFAGNEGNNNRSPELIIQDELHLISGPLGTIVGLYETAVDYLCSRKGIKPKIVASTATIRRASEQCSLLYNRTTRQFPPPGIDAGKSFFATEESISHEEGRYGRLYVGIMPSGGKKATMVGRSLASLLQRQMDLSPSDDAHRDRFWTITAYFNSLRDLGNGSAYLDDDVLANMRRMVAYTGSQRRFVRRKNELTSRVSSADLASTLKQLETVRYSHDIGGSAPTDVLLATNMISVGIDIARLNVMLMQGQPKLTSEYIQASSRVGRNGPGVVTVLYDAMKSRDRSYYEQFKSYHDAYYRHVEPTAVTPYSEPVLERCLHAALIACLRGTPGLGLSDNTDACYFRNDIAAQSNARSRIKEYFVNRLRDIIQRAHDEGSLEPADGTDVQMLETCIDGFYCRWERLANDFQGQLRYGEMKTDSIPSNRADERWLMKPFGCRRNFSHFQIAIDTLMAMRNVDTTVGGFLREEM